MCELHLPVSRQGHLMRLFAFVESAVRWYIALPVNISCTPHHNCIFCSFVFLTDSFCIWKLKSSRVPFSLMYFQKWLTTLSEYVCVRLAGCAPSNNFRCRMGVNHWRKCSKHIQQNLSKCLVPCKYSVFLHWKEKDRASLFLRLLSREVRWVVKQTHKCGQITVTGGLQVSERSDRYCGWSVCWILYCRGFG